MKTTVLGIQAGLSPAAAHLLYRISYWWPKAKAEFEGRKFIAKTREEWCANSGLTLQQYKTALALLKRKGFVRTEQHIWTGKAVIFLELTAALQVGPDGLTQVSPIGLSQDGPNGPTQGGPKGPTLKIQKILTEDTTEGRRATDALDTPYLVPLQEVTGENGRMGKTVAEMAGLLNRKKEEKRQEWREQPVDPSRKDTPTQHTDSLP